MLREIYTLNKPTWLEYESVRDQWAFESVRKLIYFFTIYIDQVASAGTVNIALLSSFFKD